MTKLEPVLTRNFQENHVLVTYITRNLSFNYMSRIYAIKWFGQVRLEIDSI